MSALHGEHGQVDVRVADRFVESVAVKLLVHKQGFHERLHRRPDGGERFPGHFIEVLDLRADFVLDLADAGAKYLVHGAIPVGGLDALDRVHEAWVEVGENPESDLHIEPARPTSREQVLRRESGQVDLRQGGRPNKHLLGAPTERPSLAPDADSLGAVVDRGAEESVPGLVVGRSPSQVKRLGNASHRRYSALASAAAASAAPGPMHSSPIWQLPPRQQGPITMGHPTHAKAKAPCGALAMSDLYFAKAPALMTALGQVKAQARQLSPSATATQSVSVVHDWS
jgi:hypothetical protein